MNLRSFYGILAVISTLAAIQSMIFPRWPQASQISTQKLNQFQKNVSSNSHTVNLLPPLDEHSDYNMSHTSITRFKIDSNSDLTLTNVQVRDRKDLEVSHITESIKSLHLKQSASRSKQPPFYLSETTSSGTTFQTCFVPSTPWPLGIAVNQDQLTLAVDQVKSAEKNLAVKRFLGLSPSRRYQCMLITLKTTLPTPEGNQLWLTILRQIHNNFN
jgi:hypothetical protein